MGNETLSTYKESEATLYPPQRWNKPVTKVLTRRELIRSNKELEQVAFTASHDLQEPLKIVSLYLQVLKRKYKGKLDDKADEDISSILDRTERMQKLIQNILGYARIGKGDVSFTKLDSNMLLKQAINNLKVIIEENSAQIIWEDCPMIMGDEIQLIQLFQNLINNAIKFCKKGECPCVYISVKQKDDRWVFAIKDNGIGIEQENVQNVFGIFRRLHSQSQYAGNGIGLSLCKRIVEFHRGNIWAESEIGKGSTFYFNIPKI